MSSVFVPMSTAQLMVAVSVGWGGFGLLRTSPTMRALSPTTSPYAQKKMCDHREYKAMMIPILQNSIQSEISKGVKKKSQSKQKSEVYASWGSKNSHLTVEPVTRWKENCANFFTRSDGLYVCLLRVGRQLRLQRLGSSPKMHRAYSASSSPPPTISPSQYTQRPKLIRSRSTTAPSSIKSGKQCPLKNL
jgi:hypothetical protein